jgi:hypothetical protein
VRNLVTDFCLDCHNSGDQVAGIDLESITSMALEQNGEIWEKTVTKLRARQMPPREMPRPDEPTLNAVLSSLERSLDRIAAEHPRPGRVDTFRRLTRAEYENTIRDLLSLEIDATKLLPKDESSHGFDNVTVGGLSPSLLNRYIAAARKISRLAVGSSQKSPGGDTIRIPPDRTQEERVEGLPIGTRGGVLIPYTFPRDGEYEVRIRLSRDRNEHVEGLREPHQLE